MRTFTAVLFASVLPLLATSSLEALAQGDVTPHEQLWVEGVWPVFAQATSDGLPVDIVVQPQPAPGTAPLALAFLGGRCKLVFSMRENALVQEQEERIEQELGTGKASLFAALELMAAHELFGHCARHVAGLWHAVPDGYVEILPRGLGDALQADFSEMRAARREEGYADLAALAWAHANRYPSHARLHAWLAAERSHDLIEGSHHDTLAWLKSAGSGQATFTDIWRDVLLQEASAAASGQGSTRTAQRGSQAPRDTLRVSQR